MLLSQQIVQHPNTVEALLLAYADFKLGLSSIVNHCFSTVVAKTRQ